MHIGIQFAGTSHASLHFIKNQQRIVAIAEFAQSLQKGLCRRHHATFPLNRLNNNRTGGVINQLAGRVKIVIHRMADIRRQWRKILRIGRLAPGADGKQRATVEGVFKRDDAAFLRVETVVSIFTRQF
ncbi:hypothetical protein D3C73_1186980 [compost metagenome]